MQVAKLTIPIHQNVVEFRDSFSLFFPKNTSGNSTPKIVVFYIKLLILGVNFLFFNSLHFSYIDLSHIYTNLHVSVNQYIIKSRHCLSTELLFLESFNSPHGRRLKTMKIYRDINSTLSSVGTNRIKI